MKTAKIAVRIPIFKLFSYIIPEEFSYLKPGDFVLIPFGTFKTEGVIVELEEKDKPDFNMKEIIRPIGKEKSLDPVQLKMADHLHRYFLNHPGASYFQMLSAGTKKEYSLVYSITEKGIDALMKNTLKPEEKRILEVFEKEKRFTSMGLKKKIKDFKPYILSKLVESEMIIKENTKRKESKLRQLQYVRFISETDLKELSDINVVNYLKRYDGWCPINIIKKKFQDVDLVSLQKKGNLEIKKFPCIPELFLEPDLLERTDIELNKYQKKAYDDIMGMVKRGKFSDYLLMGVTGSGKTEVYYQAAQETVKVGKKVIVLVPEISLTNQVVGVFKQKFKENIAVYHSKLTASERKRIHAGIKEGSFDIVIGPRSILFLPLKDVGLVIMDEFQDDSYDQINEPYYNGVEMVEFFSRLHDSTLVYISATPSVNMYYRLQNGEIKGTFLPERAVENSLLPDIELINMSEENDHIFSVKLTEEMRRTLEEGEQVILFYNRRGFFRYIKCRKCGYTFKCEDCDVNLVYHYDTNEMLCHYCGRSYKVPSSCPDCNNFHLDFKGMGIEQVFDVVKERFPGYRIERLDQDVSADIMKLQNILADFRSGDIDILIGTQIIAKGLNFLNVTLVGVISAEVLFNIPDFKTAERGFNLLTQVAGRSGRGGKKGKVLVQTYNPGNEIIKHSLDHNFDKFYDYEIRSRGKLKFPPFMELVKIVVYNKKEEKALDTAKEITDILNHNSIRYSGPMPAIVKRINNVYHYDIIVKYNEDENVYPVLVDLRNKFKTIRIIR